MTQSNLNDTETEATASVSVYRFAAAVEYDGSSYHGWQAQKSGVATVQREVERALSFVANHPVVVSCAGRTDSGVHASKQIIHFDAQVDRGERGWCFGTNTKLPDDIALSWVKPVSHDFHARYGASYRRYRYVILNQPTRPAILPKGVTWNHKPLDDLRMQRASQCLLGTHDFSSYRAVACQANSPVRCITDLSVKRYGDIIVIDVQATAFLHHMIRNIAGVLMAIGEGAKPEAWAQQVLEARDRREGGVTAKPHGLYFVDVGYAEEFKLPRGPLGPHFLSYLLQAQ